ncbi:MAG: NAD-dependent epimerase/dehydratase family protein [Planctomycetia bacterium]|nr:NAD-dependent epimerase/dehydratase family protein [Planctomycetia bacterium]
MRVLITGGAGFIGCHASAALLELGHDVTVVDDLSLGSRNNVSHLLDHERFQLQVFDLLDSCALDALMASAGIECVFHLAANSDIARSHDNPDVDFDRTLRTTYNVLRSMRAHDVKQIVFASTSAIYGDSSQPLDESYGPLLPVSHYGAAKLAGEAFISSFVSNYGMQAWIARFPNVVGEKATHGAIFDFINRLRSDPHKLRVLGDGRQAKPYLYVRDLVDGLLHIWQHAHEQINVYNIGVASRTSVKQIVDTVVSEMQLTPEIQYTGGSRGWIGDVPQVTYRIDKLHSLGWRAKCSSDEAVVTAVRAILDVKS